jgi:multiple sugar transport system permease protein
VAAKRRRHQFFVYALLMIVVVATLFPIFWVVSSSFKTEFELFSLPAHWLPETPTLTSYAAAFASQSGVGAISNSLAVAIGGTFLALLIGFPSAYVISRYRGGRFAVFVLPLIMRATPPAVIAIPLLIFYSSVGMVDTLQGLVLPYSAATVFYVIWMIKPFIDAVPRELEDAAMIDGVPRWRIPFGLILPIVAGGVAAAAIFVFVLDWTEFTLALMLTRMQTQTIPLQMAAFNSLGAISEGQGQAAALSTVSLAPFLTIAYVFQKKLVSAFSAGAVNR